MRLKKQKMDSGKKGDCFEYPGLDTIRGRSMLAPRQQIILDFGLPILDSIEKSKI
jgi:hypothetical protein